MKVLMVHNSYQQPGGEDVVADSEAAMLRDFGHEVLEYRRSNSELMGASLWRKTRWPVDIVWARDAYRDISGLLAANRPDIAHFHNTFMMVSPGAYYACSRHGVPVVQTVHNPRLFCPAARLFRDGCPCQDCRKGLWYFPGISRRCYRGSAFVTGAVVAMTTFHNLIGTWKDKVDTYIASTGLYRDLLLRYGIPKEKITLKPHLVHPDPGARQHGDGEFALFAGRLTTEKGVRTMIRAWRLVGDVPLTVCGEGPLLGELREAAAASGPRPMELKGWIDRAELARFMKRARFLVWPSKFESFGLVAVEAFAAGIPVVAPRAGVMGDIVTDGVTGIHFSPGDPADLAAKVRWAWEYPEEMKRMGKNARAEYEKKYTAEANYGLLMDIYKKTIEARRRQHV